MSVSCARAHVGPFASSCEKRFTAMRSKNGHALCAELAGPRAPGSDSSRALVAGSSAIMRQYLRRRESGGLSVIPDGPDAPAVARQYTC